jgi:hypothetical protein
MWDMVEHNIKMNHQLDWTQYQWAFQQPFLKLGHIFISAIKSPCTDLTSAPYGFMALWLILIAFASVYYKIRWD